MNENNNDETAVQNCRPFHSILDSNLIVTAKNKFYDLKIVKCGDYIQVYQKERKFKINAINLKSITNDDDIKKVDTDNLKKIKNKEDNINNEIKERNINRSKFECQRLAKSNSSCWKSFITLTFENNITDIDFANKKLRIFLDSVKRVFQNFKYIGIPEFQKRGAVHYHLLTNISCNSNIIPKQIKKKLYNPSSKSYKLLEYYNIKYWNYGYSSAEIIENDIKKIVGYISKYMTKDIDNRLFNRHRYFCSRNLIKPNIIYIDFSDDIDQILFNSLINNKKIIYENDYENKYNNEKIYFKEYL